MDDQPHSGHVKLRLLSLLPDYLVNFLSVVAAAILGYVLTEQHITKLTLLGIAGVYVVLSGVVFYIKEIRKQELADAKGEALSKTREAANLEAQRAKEQREEAIDLSNVAISTTTRILRILSEQFRRMSSTHGGLLQAEQDKETARLRQHLLEEIMRGIRSVFESDKRGIDTTTFPYNYFKIALYEPDHTRNPKRLRRTFYEYPEGFSPGEGTAEFDLETHLQAAVVISFLNQRIEIVEDIPEESRKAKGARWMDMRPGQAGEYASMVCAPLVSGKKGFPERHCLGVIVIDTNRKRYFLETREFEAFLGNLLNPFRTLLTITLELPKFVSKKNQGAARTPQNDHTLS